MPREIIECDVVIVGAGSAGLAAAIRLKQLAPDVRVCVIEKGSQVGSHILSGAVLETRSLNELIPDWRAQHPPSMTPVTHNQFLYLTKRFAIPLPTPPQMHHPDDCIISLSNVCQWLAKYAENLGVNIYPGFSAADILWDHDGNVAGVIIGDREIDQNSEPTDGYQPGIELRAKYTLFAEGCQGPLTKKLIKHFELAQESQPQTYGIGIKELWQIDPKHHRPGSATHTVGWPLDHKTYGGSFLYHSNDNRVAVGFVASLDYKNPYLSPFQELQRFKTHPAIRRTFEGGQRIGYGARALVEGGWQSIPQLAFPGGLLIGDTAGFLNVPKIKGIHTAMKSGMVAAETVAAAITQNNPNTLFDYPDNLKRSWLWDELYRARNIRPAFRHGLWPGLLYAAIDTYLLRGRAPWTFKHRDDHAASKKASAYPQIHYPKPDNILTFDISSSVYLSNRHRRDEASYVDM